MPPSEKAELLQSLHRRDDLLVVPNAWDVASARVIEAAGLPTTASSSAAFAWSIGYPDGERAPWEDVITGLARMAAAVDIPISADLEGGYVGSTGGMDRTVQALAEAGVAGVGLEDSAFGEGAEGVVDAEAHAELIATARATADSLDYPLFINGRTELYIRPVGEDDARLEEAARRLALYADAGADGAFCPGITDPDEIAQLAERLSLPLNVLWMPGMPGLDELERLGTRRVTIGSQTYLGALAAVQRIAEGLRDRDLQPLEELGRPSRDAMRRIVSL
jgi:2-methylisocitrate lyase-like PEP mutase family enzyme